MIKRNRLSALLMAVVMLLSLTLVGCTKEPTPTPTPCTQHTDADTDGKCDVCGEEVPLAQVDMTEGVYNASMGSYELLIKFYDESTYYLQNETTGYRGKYEIKDEEIIFARTQADGSGYNTADHGAEAQWITGNKVIYFYQEDGVTPIACSLNKSEEGSHDASTLVGGVCYGYGTAPNALAYNTETDQIQSFAGNYGSRTLSHTTLRSFSINDEKAIEQAKFMVKVMPEGAEVGKVESDYHMTLSQKGYETNIPALEDQGITNGKYTVNGQTYSLTDTISDSAATLTVNGNTASVTVGSETVELVTWGDVQPYAAEIVGSALGGKIQAKVRFNEDGTLTIFGSTKNYSGQYKAGKDGTITVSDVDADSPVTLDNVKTADGKVTATLTIATGNDQMPTATAEAEGAVAGALYGLNGAALLKVESDEKIFGDTGMVLEMMDDCTLRVTVGGQEKITGAWTLSVDGTPSIAFEKASSGSFEFALASPARITWTGRLSDTETEDRTYTFSFPPSDLSKLQEAKPAENNVKYTVTTTVQKLGNAEITLSFLADGTLTITNPKMDIATAQWALVMNGGIPSINFENVSGGELTGKLGSNYTITWVGEINAGGGSVSVEMEFSFPSSDLANLQ